MYYAVTADTDLTTKGKRLLSWNFAENAAAAARVLLRDGGAAGPIVVDIRLPASDSKAESYPQGLVFPLGVFVDVDTGSARGSVDIAT